MSRQTELLREAFESWQAAVSDTVKTPPAEMAQKQFEHGQKAFEKALSNMRELAEMAIKSQSDAADVIRKRFEAGLKEIAEPLSGVSPIDARRQKLPARSAHSFATSTCATRSQSNELFDSIRAALLRTSGAVLSRPTFARRSNSAHLRCASAPSNRIPRMKWWPGRADVQILESTPEKPSKIEMWHTDMTFRPAPPMLTMLHGKVIPPYGGDTLFASMTAAYDALSPRCRSSLAVCTATHDFAHGFQESLAEPGGRERLATALAANPPVTHPVDPHASARPAERRSTSIRCSRFASTGSEVPKAARCSRCCSDT